MGDRVEWSVTTGVCLTVVDLLCVISHRPLVIFCIVLAIDLLHPCKMVVSIPKSALIHIIM
jgi:hypothetical protein